MPTPFFPLSPSEFSDLLNRFPFQRKIDAVHVCATGRPPHRDYRGERTLAALASYHTETLNFKDIAQHVTIAPDGTIWTGRNWNWPPVSVAGYNGNRRVGPFLIALIGNFAPGEDRFEGAQAEALAEVIARVRTNFDLAAESLRLPGRMVNASVAGADATLNYEQIQAQAASVHAALASRGEAGGAGLASVAPFDEDALSVNEIAGSLSRSVLDRDEGSGAEFPIQPEASARTLPLFDEANISGDARGGTDDLTPADLDMLRPHVVNLNMGRFSSGGIFQTQDADVNVLFEDILRKKVEALDSGKKLRLVFYAHGGLVSEINALKMARKHVPWWKANGVYPIYFVWETGFEETLGQILAPSLQRDLLAVPRDFSDITDPVLEGVARGLGGVKIWSGMKASAQHSIDAANGDPRTGGARCVAEKLKGFCDAHPGKVELHAVGHSAGAIFHAYFLPKAFELRVPSFTSVHFLAPAIRVDEFKTRLALHVGKEINSLTMYTMKRDFELRDNCAEVYRKSLLYLIYHALEPEPETPILGLQESIYADAALRKLFGIGFPAGAAEVLWSQTPLREGRSATRSTTHGGFDDDSPTMESVARRVLDLQDRQKLTQDFPESPTGRAARVASVASQAEARLKRVLLRLPQHSTVQNGVMPSAPAFTLGRAPARTSPPQTPSAARRQALCVGIDNYPNPQHRLSGCVGDARSWRDTFLRLGFASPAMLLDAQATRSAILDTISGLIARSAPGDVIAIQYSGHGTQLPDLNGDEADGLDEALCPYNFESGEFLIDDDLAAVFSNIPVGVNVTLFVDCCHSGTITRFALGTPAGPTGFGGETRARFIVATPQMIQAHENFRQHSGLTRQLRGRDAYGEAREVLFAACRDEEVAMESAGHGHFTLRATDLLGRGLAGVSHAEFARQLLAAFGPQPAQHPELHCAPAMSPLPILQPLVGNGPVSALPVPDHDGFSAASASGLDRNTITQLLRSIGTLLTSLH